MAFWKKSDDPWDRKPEKRETNWYENNTAPVADEPVGAGVPTGAEEKERLGDSLRKFLSGEEDAPIAPEPCPWCGKDMDWGRITGGRDRVIWRNWKPKGILGLSRPEGWKELDLLDEGEWTSYKTAWLCGDCGKMVLAAPVSAYTQDHPRVDFQEYSGGGAYETDPQAYEKYQEQWGAKKEE